MGAFGSQLAGAQALVVGLVILWAGVWKVAVPRAREMARDSALTQIVGPGRRAVAAHVAVGCAEIVVAALLLVAPGARVVALALGTALTLGFLVYLAVARRIAPTKPCACMGGRATRITWRSLARAGALLAMVLAGWLTPEYWWTALAAAPWIIGLLALEVAALWALSPEFSDLASGVGNDPASKLVRGAQRRLDPTCARLTLDAEGVERALAYSPAYRALRPSLRERQDTWREGCWDYIAYHAVYKRQEATVVFAAPARFDPAGVSATIVADADNSVLAVTPSRNGAAPALA